LPVDDSLVRPHMVSRMVSQDTEFQLSMMLGNDAQLSLYSKTKTTTTTAGLFRVRIRVIVLGLGLGLVSLVQSILLWCP